MKKNRLSELDVPYSNDCVPREHLFANIPVPVLIGLCLLAFNIFADRPYHFEQKQVAASFEEAGQYISITGSPKIKEGVYFLTQGQLQETFSELLPYVLKRSSPLNSAIGVTAVQYKAGLPGPADLPPELSNIFFLPIPINRAGIEVISSLPGIGPILAERIIQRRKTIGPFNSKNELLQVAGIGHKKLARLTDHIFID